MTPVPPSTKEQILLTAERLFAAHGLDGVSLRQIGTAAGSSNNSAVQYHFGSKEHLVRAIFEYRLPALEQRRSLLAARLRPADLGSWLECYLLPVLEQGEQPDSHYLSFVAKLQQVVQQRLLDDLPERHRQSSRVFTARVGAFLPDLPEPLRAHRISQSLTFSIHATADREQARAANREVLPFAVHVADLLDGLVGFLQAPASPAARAALLEIGSAAPVPRPVPV